MADARSKEAEAALLDAPGGRVHNIAAWLRDEILRGEYRAGDRLPAERDLATRLSVNRASVREALKQLEQLGLVTIRRGGGARVCHLHEASVDIVRHLLHADSEIDPSLALQILDVNEIMVAGATRLAVERASESELMEARELMEDLVAASDEAEKNLAATDALFELITRASDNLVLRLIHNAIRTTLNGELGATLWRLLHPGREALRREVDAIAVAIAARDAQGAEEAVRSMLRGRRQRLFELMNDPARPLRLRLDGETTLSSPSAAPLDGDCHE